MQAHACSWENLGEEGGAMARIKHIALSTDDPAKTAEFYKKVFGLQELRRRPADTGAEGVWLSDGYIYFAILKHHSDEAPDLGEGPSTVKGVHHIGFYVDDMEEACKTIEAESATECPGSSSANRKYKGPDGLMIDMRVRGWDEQIKARMPLYRLAPASTD
jgi:catechol 2,3-dioxygenase-like lactoylglutathione lyase family enzyme